MWNSLQVFKSIIGDLKLVEKPSPLTLAPHDFANIKASVKVSIYLLYKICYRPCTVCTWSVTDHVHMRGQIYAWPKNFFCTSFPFFPPKISTKS